MLKIVIALVACFTISNAFPVDNNPLMEGDLFEGDIAGIDVSAVSDTV